ncbi:hypothetical protein QJQ45_007105 [Haematococcus lacustris]|nr:hypothetical protein QJQ45_007105 [Haematococcus lacustris]
MAGQGAKKRIEENKRRLRLLIIWLAVGLAAQVLNLASISALAAPVYDPSSGELLDGGADLDMKGFCGYYHDVLYITVIVQVLSAVSPWFWYLYLVVPGYAGYKAAQFGWPYVKDYFNGSSRQGMTMDEATRRRMEKSEKRSERRKMKSFR